MRQLGQWLHNNRNIDIICHIGLNVGTVALGPLLRGVSTIVGKPLMVTSGIEGLTRKLKVPMLAGAAFLAGWPEGQKLYRSAGCHAVGGTAEPMEVYELSEFSTAAL